ncbi:hypothetical protein HIM_00388 [Hirsutella minnesotensis 3608]|nr:hypothetical protein HIM_00388 [Hirsutella minnesotensis 3608]
MDPLPGKLSERLKYSCHRYGDHALQRVGIWEFTDEASHKLATGHILVYIHGGAWRDPRITPEVFGPSIQRLLEAFPAARDGHQQCPIRGFASVDYRLSPGDSFPQDPTTTPKSELRDARHPDHIEDVRDALGLLAAQKKLADGYILVGHSAGATLAFQLLMGEAALSPGQSPEGQSPKDPIPLPRAIIGIAGIYDLAGLNDRVGGSYAGFMSSAFGHDQGDWQAVSPACFPGSFKDKWPGKTLALLAHSPEDGLVDMLETDGMCAKLEKDGVDVVAVKDLTGVHDFVWKDGNQVVRLVKLVLSRLREVEDS